MKGGRYMQKLRTVVFGDMTIDYYQSAESVEWLLSPTSLHHEVQLPKKTKFDSLIQAKLIGDDYPKGFSTGSTMRNSATVKSLRLVKQIDKQESNKKEIATILADDRGNHYTHYVSWQIGFPVIETYVTFENRTKIPQMLEMLASFSLSNLSPFYDENPIGNLILIRYQSKWSFEGRKTIQLLEDLQLEPSWKPSGVGLEKFGQVGSMPVRGWFPQAAIYDKQKDITWAVSLAQPGSWQFDAYRLDEDFCLSGGLADRDYGHWLKAVMPGEVFVTPKAYLTVTCGNEASAAQRLTKILTLPLAQKQHPTEEDLAIQFNEFCTSWGRPTEAMTLKNLAALKGKAIQYYVIDAGWYANQHGWERSHGDWQVSSSQFPNGLETVIAAIKQHDLIPGIWFEIETVGDQSVASTFFEHLLNKDGQPLTVGNRRFWNMRDPWVIDYLQERVINFLTYYDIGYLKIDYNENFGIGFDGKESFGEESRLQLLATQAFIKRIQQQLPDLIIENCSSGGHRLEYSMIQLTDLSSFSDAHEAISVPIIAANLHDHLLPRQSLIWAVIRKRDSPQRLFYSLISTFLGRICLSGDINELSKEQWKVIDDCFVFYDHCRPLIKDGTTTVVRSQILSYRKPTGYQIVQRELGDQALLIIHNFDQTMVELPMDFRTILHTCGFECQGIQLQKKKNKWYLSFPSPLMGCAMLIKLR